MQKCTNFTQILLQYRYLELFYSKMEVKTACKRNFKQILQKYVYF